MPKTWFFFGLFLAIFFSFSLVFAISPSDSLQSNSEQAVQAKPSDYGLKEGDLISAIFSDDPDVYIINEHGYKRLFLNPEIFKFYGHLGGFASVKLVTPEARDAFPTVGLFRNCEQKNPKVYGFESKDEDEGNLRWINTSGEEAVQDDPDFFKKVFCINDREFKWYKRGEELKSVKEVPQYHRVTSAIPATPAVPAIPASPSQPLVSPTTVPISASGSFSPTPIPTFVTQPAIPAVPATPATPASTLPLGPDTVAPSMPTGLSATAISPSQINLSWTASTDNVGVDGYKIYRNGVLWYQVTQLNYVSSLTAYADTGLSSNTSYSYYIQAFDTAGNVSLATAKIYVTTKSGMVSCSGLNLTFQGGKTSYAIGETVTYTYTCTPGGTASYVEIQVVKPDGTAVTYNSVSGSISTSTLGFGTSNLVAGNHTLRACFVPGCSSVTASLPFMVTTSSTVPPIPSNLTASMASYSTTTAPVAALKWNGGTNNVTEFRIFSHSQTTSWSTNFDRRGLELLVNNANNMIEVHIGLTASASGVYEFKVQACNSSGCSADSNTASATVGSISSTPTPTPTPTPIPANDASPTITVLSVKSANQLHPDTIYAGLKIDLSISVADDKGITSAGFNATPRMRYSPGDANIWSLSNCGTGYTNCSEQFALTPDQSGNYTITATVTDTSGQTTTKVITFNAVGCSADLECGDSSFPSSGATFCGPGEATLYTQRMKYKFGAFCTSGSCEESISRPRVYEDCGVSGKICGFSPANGGQDQCVVSPGVNCALNTAITSSCLCGKQSYEQYGYCCQSSNGSIYQYSNACPTASIVSSNNLANTLKLLRRGIIKIFWSN